MGLLSDKEKTAALQNVRGLIGASGQSAVLLRRSEEQSLYGGDDAVYAQVSPGPFPIEFVSTGPEDLSQKIDAVACVLPELDVRPQDRVQVGEEWYRVQTVIEQNLFGVVTHKVLKLVRHHGG